MGREDVLRHSFLPPSPIFPMPVYRANRKLIGDTFRAEIGQTFRVNDREARALKRLEVSGAITRISEVPLTAMIARVKALVGYPNKAVKPLANK